MKINDAKEITLTADEAKDLLVCYRIWSTQIMEEIIMGGLEETKAANISRTNRVGKELEKLLYENEII